MVVGAPCIAALVIEGWADCVAGPLLEVMDKLGLAYPCNVLLLTFIELAANITTSFSKAFCILAAGQIM